MRKFKISLCLLLFLICITASLCFSTSAINEVGQCGDGVSYYYDEENYTVYLSGSGDTYSYDKAAYSPFYCAEIQKIIIDDGVTSLGSYMFYGCSAVTEIYIPDSVISIGKSAFESCSEITEIQLPSQLCAIGNNAFAGCDNVSRFVLPSGVRSIPDFAFSGCGALSEVIFLGEVEEISPTAFKNCVKISMLHFYGKTESFSETVTVGIPENAQVHGGENKRKVIDCETGETVEGLYCNICECFVYGKSVNQAASKHIYENTILKATLTSDGQLESKCSVCGDVEAATAVYKPASFTLSTSSYTYDGKVKTPSVTVKDSKGNTLTKGTDYTVTYESGRKNPGRYTVRIDLTGNYEGTKRLYFTIAPEVPVVGKLSRSTDAIRLNWNKVTGASGYAVLQYKSGEWTRIATITKGDTVTYRVEKLKAGTTYKFKVKAYKSDDGTIWGSATDTITYSTNPATPKISSTSKSTNAVRLNWGKVTGANGYVVEQYVSGAWKRIATITKADTVTYRAEKLKSGTTYKFRIKAYKKLNGETFWSNATATKSVTTSLATPSITKISSTAKGKATLTWSDVNGETGYEVYYSTSKTGTFKKLTFKADVTSGSKTGLTSGKTYYFKVRAYKTVGSSTLYSSYSAVKSIKIK